MTTTIKKSALMAHPVSTMFALVADIESYPEFLPGCVGAEVLETTSDGVVARLDLAKAGVKQSFVTSNTNIANESIHLQLADGPLESLTGTWRFQPLSDEACKVTLDLSFELRSGLMRLAVGKLFETVANDMVGAMVSRADQLAKVKEQ
ncbi:MAG: ubiquinone-binding protein [Cellvibrionales bacterium TMED21]|nr:ubiquinone-binding protein [Halieaceae bacterium]OUT66196.1 MAG: ubiquinone-binding protein [Cellvibrionales bacterium TMED21]